MPASGPKAMAPGSAVPAVRRRAAGAPDYYERFSRVVTLGGFVLALAMALLTPLWAISWSHLPFPGFMTEQNLVADSSSGPGSAARSEGLTWPMRVTRIGGVAVTTPAEFNAVLANHEPGDDVAILTELPDGSERLFPSIPLEVLPVGELIRFFWLPYVVGLAYLVIAGWIYRARGQTRSGRALAYFAVNAALVSLLIFDVNTTHLAPALWMAALAQIGGALISLALRFPTEWKPVERRAWVLGLPYGVSVVLAVWGVAVLNVPSRPWAYISAWGASYRYMAVAVLIFLGVMIYRARTGSSDLVRRQARVVLWGSSIAFLPISVWFVTPLFGVSLPFNAMLFLPGLVVFPVAVGIAILRYRLMDADAIVNRTIVYGVLTAVLAGAFSAGVGLSQKLFVAFTGEKSDAAIVMTTLVVASAFAPMKKRLDKAVASRFKDLPDTTRELKAFGEQVRAFTQMSEAERIAEGLLQKAMASLGAQSGAFRLERGGQLQPIQACGRWTGESWLSLPLAEEGTRYGLLFLGPRVDRRPYTREEFAVLEDVAANVARAVRLAEQVHPGAAILSEAATQASLGKGNDSCVYHLN